MPPPAPEHPSSPRDRTRHDLLALLSSGPGRTRSELAETTGLAKSTVRHGITSLLEEGLVEEVPASRSGRVAGRGRPATVLRPVAAAGLVGGIDIGHAHVTVGLASSDGTLLGEQTRAVDATHERPDAALDLAASLLEQLLPQGGPPLAGVVAGVPSPLSPATGALQPAALLRTWQGSTPAQHLEDRLGVPVRVENDAVLAAVGELWEGAARDVRDFVYLKVSHGVGSALVLNGEPYRGVRGLAGEIGHSKLPGRQDLCRCGSRGCVEASVSFDAVRRQIAETHPGVDPSAVDVTAPGDAVTRRLLVDAGRALGAVAAYACNVLDPEAVVVGGELAASDLVLEGIRRSMTEYAQTASDHDVPVLRSTLGPRAELTGALRTAARRLALPQVAEAGSRTDGQPPFD